MQVVYFLALRLLEMVQNKIGFASYHQKGTDYYCLPQRHQGQHGTWDFPSDAQQELPHQSQAPYCSSQVLLPTSFGQVISRYHIFSKSASKIGIFLQMNITFFIIASRSLFTR